MSFTANMPSAARRHYQAAETLSGTDRRDVAGYLYGIAAECALKALMLEAGIRPLTSEHRSIDPYYKHFPELRTTLRNMSSIRRSAILLRFVNDDAFLNNWSITMRYSDGKEILESWIRAWSTQSKKAVDTIGTQGL